MTMSLSLGLTLGGFSVSGATPTTGITADSTAYRADTALIKADHG